MDLSVRTVSYGSGNHTWLGSSHGTNNAIGVTIDVEALTETDHYPNGYLPAGTVLANITSSGLRAPYDPADTPAGIGTATGFLLEDVKIPTDGTTDVAAAELRHGRIVEANLPLSGVTGEIDAAGKTDLENRFDFV